MGRTVVTPRDVERRAQAARAKARTAAAEGTVATAATPTTETPDTYKDRLLKYIPAEIVAIYLALLSVLKAAPAQHDAHQHRGVGRLRDHPDRHVRASCATSMPDS